MHTPRIAITLGDPAGIGPEIVLKALADRAALPAAEFCLVTDRTLLETTYHQLRQTHPDLSLADPATLDILSVPLESPARAAITPGQGNAASGDASFRFLTTAIEAALAGQFQAIVTAPIAKVHWHAAGHRYPGQTEVLAQTAQAARFGMLFVARSPHTGWTLRTLLATTHIPLRQVPDTLTPTLLSQKLALLLDCLRDDFGLAQPRIAIAGLNPHSGEQGKLGHEEQDWLIPWLAQARDRWPQATLTGPVPPDTLWVSPGRAWYGPRTDLAHDAYLALYHDQGLIPVKLLAFDQAVNTTIGLPFVRTSPDHGTAFDIAGRGLADATSLRAAIALAAELSQQRQSQQLPPIPLSRNS